METFKAYFSRKLDCPEFKETYDRECNICRNTVRIFQKVEGENIPLDALAEALGESRDALCALQEADCCDPHLVIRLCRHLGLAVPESCPKLIPLKHVT